MHIAIRFKILKGVIINCFSSCCLDNMDHVFSFACFMKESILPVSENYTFLTLLFENTH